VVKNLKGNWLFWFNLFYFILFLFFPLKVNSLLYTSSSFFVSYLFYKEKGVSYVVFLLWLFFFYGFFRRLHDFSFGRDEANPILLAPVVSSLLPLGIFFKNVFKGKLQSQDRKILVMFICLGYGFLFSLLSAGMRVFLPSLKALLCYLTGFSAFIYITSARFSAEELVKELIIHLRIFLIFGGIYGLYQLYVLPPWDQRWVDDAGLNSLYAGQRDFVRIWSTFTNPDTFGKVCYFGIFSILLSKRIHTLTDKLAIALGILCIVALQVRTMWIVFLFSILFLEWKKKKKIIKLIPYIALVVFVAQYFIDSDQLLNVIVNRASTIADLKDDRSSQIRLGQVSLVFVDNFKSSAWFMGKGLHEGMESGFLSILNFIGFPLAALFYKQYFSLLLFLSSCAKSSRYKLFFPTSIIAFTELFSGAYFSNPLFAFWVFMFMGILYLEFRDYKMSLLYRGF
jgi:putative inorganic carbon (HCO3(-)) transporter